MFSTGSKYFFGVTFLGAVSFAIYMLLIGESAIGATALFGLVAATGLLTALVLATRDGAKDEDGVAASTSAPTGSIWPLIAAVGATLLLVGTITSPLVTLFGIIALLAALIEWTVLSWSERASSDVAYNAALRKRLLNPIEFPVLAAAGLGVVIFSFSRITLAVNKSVGATAFIVIGSLVLAAGVLFSTRPNLKRSLVSGICVVGAVGIVAAGIAGAGVGVREELVLAKEEGHYMHQECGAEKSEHFDKLPLEGVSATSSVDTHIDLIDGKLVASVQGIAGQQNTITIPRSNATNIVFRNRSDGEYRLVASLGSKMVTDGVKEDVVQCTQLIPQGSEQMLTLNIPKPAVDGKPFTLTVPGLAGQSIEVIVP
jgi:hypothetical protein